jgi:hypothetical protein
MKLAKSALHKKKKKFESLKYTAYFIFVYINTESTTESDQKWGFWGFTIFGKG